MADYEDDLSNYTRKVKKELDLLDGEELKIPTPEGTIYLTKDGYRLNILEKGESEGIFPKALEKIIKKELKKQNSCIEP